MTAWQKFTVRLFAVARTVAQCDRVELSLPSGATVADLRAALLAAHPALAPILPHAIFSVNSDYAAESTVLPSSAEIACIPPVSGG